MMASPLADAVGAFGFGVGATGVGATGVGAVGATGVGAVGATGVGGAVGGGGAVPEHAALTFLPWTQWVAAFVGFCIATSK